jgi:hypothetical protein
MMLVRYGLVGGVLTPYPIAIPMNPENAVLNPGLSNEELKQTSFKGETQTVLTFLSESLPELQLTFGGATPEIEAAMLNRIAATETSQQSWVYFEATATSTSIAGRTTGQHGYEVALQVEGASEAIVYYIDPLTKLAKQLTVVDATPSGDELIIGANLALTLSAELVAAGVNLYGWVPGVTFANSTKIGSESPVLYGAYLEGVSFDNTVKTVTCNRLSWMPGGNIEKAPQRSLNFRVLPDSSDTTGLGYTIRTFRGTVAL